MLRSLGSDRKEKVGTRLKRRARKRRKVTSSSRLITASTIGKQEGTMNDEMEQSVTFIKEND